MCAACFISAREYYVEHKRLSALSKGVDTPITSEDLAENTPFENTEGTQPIADVASTSEVAAPPSPASQVLTLSKKDSVGSLLVGAGIKDAEVNKLLKAMAQVTSPRSLQAGLQLHATFTRSSDDTLLLTQLAFKPQPENKIVINRGTNGDYKAEKIAIPLTRALKLVQGNINASFYSTARKLNVTMKIVNEAATALSYTVNMQTGVKSGDPFELLYEVFTDPDGDEVKVGDLRYVSVLANGNKHRIYRFKDKAGYKGYFNGNGESVERSLLQTPVDLRRVRISSRFGLRVHPIRGYTLQHKGIDFAAPRGTAVMAAGDGVVVQAGYYGNYGNYIKIRHNGGYETVYAHLHKMNTGVHAGAQVKQRQVIGFVGSTGSSTGNHLHHEVLLKGKHINPQGIKQLPARKLSVREVSEFNTLKAEVESAITKTSFSKN
jgi:murein DD-endopeptidase MepM/ murein hydrolase activator NlpD